MNSAFSFHPHIQRWFTDRYGSATPVQQLAWPEIAAGKHLLISAPTGSGKTLTAFLCSLNRFATGDLATGSTRVLYISPLKALNNDIQRNLLAPLAELKDVFAAAGDRFPEVSVATRSGDTDAELRRRMLRHPPEILITTPESLNLLLSSRGGQSLLHTIDTLILDEIHSVVSSKRGVYLMSAVERLVPMSGEFQRISLSATVNPLPDVARFVGGFRREGEHYIPRELKIIDTPGGKQYAIDIRYPEEVAKRPEGEKVWDYLAQDLLERIRGNQSTLVFVNSRALCEKLTWKLNRAAGRLVAYAHHGSLSREIRAEVESRLKQGQLEAIVATSSLEMGIDIGALDEVILVQSPDSIASSIQRIGRAGHQVGAVSRCTLYPTHPQDFVESAVLARAVMERDIEPVGSIQGALDVLAQVIVSMTGTASWDIDELFAELRRSTPYNGLSRTEFDLVLNMLAGRYADRHIRELKPRVSIDRLANTLAARKGALLSLYLSGGVIPDRGYFQLRHEGDNARIGELDEEFVWEASVGQVFSLGTQAWQVKKITHNDVIVGPGKPGTSSPPFWKSETLSRNFHYAERIGQFLETANEQLDRPEFQEELIETYHTEPPVAEEIIRYLQRQREHTDRDLPHRRHLLVETIRSGPQRAPGCQVVLHTGWGARVNRPFAMALEAGWQQAFGELPEVYTANESIVIQLPHALGAAALLELAPADQLERLLRHRLEGSGFFGARFRENAGRALLLSRGRFNERKPLWMSRLQSQKLMDAVMKYEDFPILLETWRSCLQDEFDLQHLRQLLGELERGDIRLSEVETATPSPFAAAVAWDQVNTYMYMNDTPRAGGSSRLRDSLLQEVVFSPGLRPAVPAALVQEFEQRRQRLAPGYPPQDGPDLVEWVKERSLIPAAEWEALCDQLEFDPAEADGSLTRIEQAGATLVVAREDANAFGTLLHDPESDLAALDILLGNWMQYYGPLASADVQDRLGLPPGTVAAALARLEDAATAVAGQLVADDPLARWCEADNYEYLLRLMRARSRPTVSPEPLEALTCFMFNWQTRFSTADPVDRVFETVERLRGLPLAPELWEAEVLPARIPDYHTRSLDLLFTEGELQWLGLGDQQVSLCFRGDRELLTPEPPPPSELLPDAHARYEFGALRDKTGLSAGQLTAGLWQEAWQTRISNDGMAALRQGIQHRFEAPPFNPAQGRRAARAGFNRLRAALPAAGAWYALAGGDDSPDALTRQELDKDRARLMLNRYGVVFRELCQRESAACAWREIFRALRLMELGGEVVSGYFFQGISGPQYMTPAALRLFQQQFGGESGEGPIFFLCAADPISPSGLGLGAHGDQLPRRMPSNHLVMHGSRLVLGSRRNGRVLDIFVPPDAPEMGEYLGFIDHLCYRSFQPRKQFRIDEINGEPAPRSPYLAALETRFNLVRDYQSVTVQREL